MQPVDLLAQADVERAAHPADALDLRVDDIALKVWRQLGLRRADGRERVAAVRHREQRG
jgi:hypothetical protein